MALAVHQLDPNYRMIRSPSAHSAASTDFGLRPGIPASPSFGSQSCSDIGAEARSDFPGATQLQTASTPVVPGLEGMMVGDRSPDPSPSVLGADDDAVSCTPSKSPDEDSPGASAQYSRKRQTVKLTAELIGKFGVAAGRANPSPRRNTLATHLTKFATTTTTVKGKAARSGSTKDDLSGMYSVIRKLRDEQAKEKEKEKKKRKQFTVLAKSQDTIEHLQEALKSKSMSPDEPWRRWWDLLILFIITYYWIVVPLQYVSKRAAIWNLCEAFASIILAIDCAMRFRTSFVESTSGLVVDNPQKVQENYLYGDFAWDFLAAVPADLFVLWLVGSYGSLGPKSYLVVAHLRLLKILRVSSLFQIVNTMKLNKNVVNFRYTMVPNIKMVFYAVLALHLVTVSFMLINTGDKINDEEAYDYTTSLYWTLYTVTTVGYGDIPVDTPNKRRFACVLFLIGVLLHGVCISEITLRMQKANIETERHDKMTETLNVMQVFNIPEELQKEVLAFQHHKLHSCVSGAFVQVLETLPVTMRNRVGLYVRVKFICQVPMFAEQPIGCLVDLANGLKNIVLEPEQTIIQAGDTGAEMFFVGHGYCDVLSPTGDHWGVIKPGGFFGEIALLTECKRTATIKTLTYCDLFQLPKDKFLEIHEQHQELKEAVSVEMEKRQIKQTVAQTEQDDDSRRMSGQSSFAAWADPSPTNTRQNSMAGAFQSCPSDGSAAPDEAQRHQSTTMSELLMSMGEGTQILSGSVSGPISDFVGGGEDAAAAASWAFGREAVLNNEGSPLPAVGSNSPSQGGPGPAATLVTESVTAGTTTTVQQVPGFAPAAASTRKSLQVAVNHPLIAMTPPPEKEEAKRRGPPSFSGAPDGLRMRRWEEKLDDAGALLRRIEDLVGALRGGPAGGASTHPASTHHTADTEAASPVSSPRSGAGRRGLSGCIGSSGSLSDLKAKFGSGGLGSSDSPRQLATDSPYRIPAASPASSVHLSPEDSCNSLSCPLRPVGSGVRSMLGRTRAGSATLGGSPPLFGATRSPAQSSPPGTPCGPAEGFRRRLHRSASQASVESMANGVSCLVGLDEPVNPGISSTPRRRASVVSPGLSRARSGDFSD